MGTSIGNNAINIAAVFTCTDVTCMCIPSNTTRETLHPVRVKHTPSHIGHFANYENAI